MKTNDEHIQDVIDAYTHFMRMAAASEKRIAQLKIKMQTLRTRADNQTENTNDTIIDQLLDDDRFERVVDRQVDGYLDRHLENEVIGVMNDTGGEAVIKQVVKDMISDGDLSVSIDLT